MARYLQEPSKDHAERLIALTAEACDLSSQYPGLWEQLSEVAWPSGRPRVTSTLMVFVEEGQVKLCLHDREGRRSLWVSGGSLTDALVGMETCLREGRGDWRKDKAFPRK